MHVQHNHMMHDLTFRPVLNVRLGIFNTVELGYNIIKGAK